MNKVAHITTSVSRNAGGLFFCMTSLTRGINKSLDIVVEVLGYKDEAFEEDAEAWRDVACQAFPTEGPKALATSVKLRENLKVQSYNLLHTHGIWQMPSKYVYDYFQSHGVPYIVSPHGMLDPWALQNSRWKKRIVEWLYEKKHLRNAACIHALCESEYDAIRAYGLTNPVCVIPNGVDMPSIDQPVRDCVLNEKTLLFIGRVHPKKGVIEALKAWSSVATCSWNFVIAGWDQGGHQQELIELCDDLAIRYKVSDVASYLSGDVDASGGCVYFVGPAFDEAKSCLLVQSDAFILSSHSEGLPMSILEAWSYALPVVMTPQCNLPEGVASGAAIQVELDATDGQKSVAAGLRELFSSSSQELDAMGERGKDLVAEKFTWEAVSDEFVKVYHWVLGIGPRPKSVRE